MVDRVCQQCGIAFRSPRDWVGKFCGKPCVRLWLRTRPRRQTRQSIRRLRDDEPLPSGEPERYKAGSGYVVLRWKVGVRSYVECLEHRAVAGRHLPEVHHRNRMRDDNRPENLLPVTTLEHGEQHSTIKFDEAARLYASGWSLVALARRYGVHYVSVLRFLKKRGVAIRTPWETRRLRERIA